MRARRLVAVAAVAAGLVALSGCRSEPGVAAYVGDFKITEDRVTGIVDELRGAVASTAGQPAAAAEQTLPSRSQVVSTVLLNQVCQQHATAQGLRPQGQVQPEMISQQLGLPPGTEYPKLIADLYTCLSGVPTGALVAPTEQELTELVEAGKRAEVIPAEVTVQEAASQLDGEQLRGALAQKKALAEIVDAANVTVNPRYRPLEFPVLSFQGNVPAVSIRLGEADTTAVTDLH